jgi:GTP-binding protein
LFVDECEVTVSGGRGGDGCVAFLREKYRPHGGPGGGDGGRGGSVIFEASDVVDTLLGIRRLAKIKAENGKPGGNKKMHGRGGRDRVIRVPLGTIVRDAENGRKLTEITEPGQRWTAARGGKGGRGNPHFATPRNRAPRKAEPGRAGKERRLRLDLKLIADVGLVGLPNAGKSTLLSRISAARPKVADYPFTTLSPAPGVVDVGEYRQMVVADLPGLIEGASRGVGLGAEFLRHTERTTVVLHLVDLVPADGGDPVDNYRKIRAELEDYSAAMAAKPELVAGTKLDLTAAREAAGRLGRELGRDVLAFSAATGENLEKLVARLWEMVRAERDRSAREESRSRPARVPPHRRNTD